MRKAGTLTTLLASNPSNFKFIIFEQDKTCLIGNFRLINPTAELFNGKEASTSEWLVRKS